MLRVDIQDYTHAFGARRLFDRVTTSLSWDSGDDTARVIGLMGASGSGKTTLARQILAARYGGAVEGLHLAPATASVAYLPQTSVLFPHMTLDRNARLLQSMGRYRDRFDPELFTSLTRSLRLEHLFAANPSVDRLSGGEAQRVMLLRTLSIRPELLILDEPASGLDAAVREAFLIDLQALLRRLRICALYISHHWDEVSFLAGRVAYAETASLDGRSSVVRLDVSACTAFAGAPPTIEAFQSVHGPGCSIWRLADCAVACMPPPTFISAGAQHYVHGDIGFRLSTQLASELSAGRAVRAAIYHDGRFRAWDSISSAQLSGGADWATP